MRCQNGNPGSTRFDAFWAEMSKYFNEISCAAQERRHGTELYFCQFQLRLLKHFAVRFKDNASMLCLYVIRVGEPSRSISATVRQHNRCLAPLHGAAAAALDHDFHICGVIPSVAFTCEIPNSPSDSFFSGDVHVVLKDKIFYPSNVFRHGTEIARLVRDKYSPDGVVADKPIIFSTRMEGLTIELHMALSIWPA